MPKTKATFNSKQGLSMLGRAMPKFVTHFMVIEEEAWAKRDTATMLRCHEIAFPYCFPKLQAIAANPAQEEGLRILRKLAASRQLDKAKEAQVSLLRYSQLDAQVVDSTAGDSDSTVVDGEVVTTSE